MYEAQSELEVESAEQIELEVFACSNLRALEVVIRHKMNDNSMVYPGYGVEFKNDVFEMHTYNEDGCTCGAEDNDMAHVSVDEDGTLNHRDDCHIMLPNFKCGKFEISWYKTIGRGTDLDGFSSTVLEGIDQVRDVFNKCFDSLK